MTAICATCPLPLAGCDVLCNAPTCVECERRSIRNATTSTSEWGIFVRAIREAVGADRLVHQSAVRPLIRGRIKPKSIGTLYRRAKTEGLLVDTGDREPSDDFAGRNGDKLDRIYALAGAA